MEKRKTDRVSFKVHADAAQAEQHYQGTVENLSLDGFFFKTEHVFTPGEMLQITFSLDGDSSHAAITAQGNVARITNEGVGVKFKEMDLDSFESLKNIVLYNNDPENSDHLLEEFFKNRAT